MITLFKPNETDFEHNGLGSLDKNIINPVISEDLNGIFQLTFTYPIFAPHGPEIQGQSVVRAPVPGDEDGQLFRIYRPLKSMGYLEVSAYHIFYDLIDNFIEDTNVVGKNGQGAVQQILGATQYNHTFRGTSDISTSANARLVRMNPIEALLDEQKGNSFVNRWGGELKRDNFNVRMMKNIGANRGKKIRHRKDLIGYEADVDFSSVVTRIMPQGFDGLLLTEKYIDSPLISSYVYPKIKKLEYPDIKAAIGEYADDEDAIPLEDALQLLREAAEKEYFVNKIDIPNATYRVDFVALDKTEEYKDLQDLQTILIGDIVTVIHEEDSLEIEAKMINYDYDPLDEKYLGITLGNFKNIFTDVRSETISLIGQLEETTKNTIQTAANGKNKIFRGPDEPTIGLIEGDLWYKPVGNGEKTLYQWTGTEWEELVSTAVNNEIDTRLKDAKTTAESAQERANSAYERVQKAIDDAEEAYNYADSALESANEKNTVYRGVSKPSSGEKGDIWFRETTDGWITHVHNGTDFEESALDGKSIAGVINFGDVTALNFDANAITTGNIQIDRGLKVVNNGQDVLKVENGNVVMDVDNLLIKSNVSGEGFDNQVNTAIYQDNQAIGLIYEEDGQTKSLIHLGPDGPYLSGKNIVLNGDTIVNGSFTVTDEIFAESMNISKFKVGTLNGAEVNLINLNADNIVTGTIRSQVLENSGIATFGQLEGTKQDIEGNFETTLNEYSQIKDTRDVNRPPSWYQSNYPKKNVREFKRTAVMGIGASLETYGVLTTEVPWGDESGGRIKQSFHVSDKLYTRSGSESSWSAWRESPNTHELATSGQTIINGDNITTGKVKDQHGRTIFDLMNGDIRFNHTDGTYTRMGRYGLERFTGGDNRSYHYLISIHTFVYGESSSNARWIQLPDDFKGKQFKVYLAMADSMSVANYNRVLQRFVATKHPNHNVDIAGARVPVIAYKSESLGDGTAPNISNVQGMLIAIY